MSDPVITWTYPKLRRFKRAYKAALVRELDNALAARPKIDVFLFDGHEFVAGYAKYLIEYLESRFRREP